MLEYGLALFAGILSILSPCVLPMLPIIIASSMQTAPRYILMLPLGLATCFTLLGVGSSFLLNIFGIATFELQKIAGILFLILGFWLIFSSLADYFNKNSQNLLQKIFQPLQNKLNNSINRLNLTKGWGQFTLGFLLAMTWSPCIGPTLGVALSLAASGQNLIHAGLIMFLYSLGIAMPFVLIIYLGKRYRLLQSRLQHLMPYLKIIFGLLIFVWGLMVVMQWDKALSSGLLNTDLKLNIFNAK